MKKNREGWENLDYPVQKMVRIMKLTVLLFFLGFVQLYAFNSYAQKTKLSLDLENTSIESVLMEIENQSLFKFIYNKANINVDALVNIHMKDKTIHEILDVLFENEDIDYSFYERQIILSKVVRENNQVKILKVSGKVTDSSGSPLPGVTVVVKGTTQGTITDADGKYFLANVPNNSTLVFSFVGMKSQEIPVGGESTINITMEEETIGLDEVVAIGYGTQKRADITGAVAEINSQNIKDIPVVGLSQALTGQMAGVRVSEGSYAPGAGPRVLIRGMASISGTQAPLYVIDGFPVEGNSGGLFDPLNSISTDDIESISVLKDAASTSIYGSRANGGVVIVTTKKGRISKPTISFRSYMGMQSIPDFCKPKLLNAMELAQYAREWIEDDVLVRQGRVATGTDFPASLDDPASYGEGTDWWEEVTRVTPKQSYSFSLNGGNESVKYFLSAGYVNQKGTVLGTGYERFTFRTNLSANITEKLRFGLEISPSYQIVDGNNADPSSDLDLTSSYLNTNGLNKLFVASPVAKVRDENGQLIPTTANDLPGGNFLYTANPVLEFTAIDDVTTGKGVLLNTFLEYDILKNLHLKTSIGFNSNDSREEYYQPSTVITGWNGNPPVVPKGYQVNGNAINYLWENTLNYSLAFKKVHRFNALAGFTVQRNKSESITTKATDFPNDDIKTYNAAATITATSSVSEYALISYLGRVNYVYDDRYLVTASFRTDGCSRFGEDNRWANFPSVSLGWRISKEDFFSGLTNVVNGLKLKASYGLIGNNSVSNYAALGSTGSDNYVLGGSFVKGTVVSSIPNYNLGWEMTRQIDFGMDLGLFKNRIFLVADFYKARTKDLFYTVPIAYISGFTTTLSNIGEVENKGMEFDLTTKNITRHNFSWNTNLNISFNRNKVLKLGDDDQPIYEQQNTAGLYSVQTHVGQPIGLFYGLEYQGLYTQEDLDDASVAKYSGVQLGSPKFKDANENGTIDGFSDYVLIGNPHPKFTYGMTNTFIYKNFDLNIIIVGAYGQEIMDHNRQWSHNLRGIWALDREVLDRYRPGDDPTTKTVPTTVNGAYAKWITPNSTWIFDGSYLTVRNITLGYTVPNNNILMKNMRLYVTLQNPLVLTRYHANPEVNRVRAPGRVQGVDKGSYPMTRIYAFGINLSL